MSQSYFHSIAPIKFEGPNTDNPLAYRYYDDPNWSRLAWGRHYFEQELALFGGDPWRDGLAANRPYLARFLAYAHDQGLVGPTLTPEALFEPSTWET